MGSETATASRVYDRLAGGYDQRWHAYIDETLQAVLERLNLQGQKQASGCGWRTPDFTACTRCKPAGTC